MDLKELWSVYHAAIPHCLQLISEAPEIQRLQHIGMNCGCEYTSFPRFRNLRPYSRFQHSMGVGLIVWHFTESPTQAVSALLHDIATPVFAHVVDFLHGDHEKQESTEAATESLIAASSAIQTALSALDLPCEAVVDYHRYPIADNDSPLLSADRLEYTLGNLYNYGICSLPEIRSFYQDLTVTMNEENTPELAFQTPEIAAAFTQSALQTARIYIADEDRFAMQMLADLLKQALERGVLVPCDLHTTESTVIQKLLTDNVCAPLWQRFRSYSRVTRSAEVPDSGQWVRVPAKLRYIDPLAVGHGRVSQFDPRSGALLDDFRATRFDYWVGTDEKNKL